jgi:hypothetical protein
MGCCPSCGAVLNSTGEVAEVLGVSDSRVRGVLADHPRRLAGRRVGWLWVVPTEGVGEFRPQPSGVRLPASENGREPAPSVCPGCRQRLLSATQAAAELRVGASRVRAILARNPDRLRAFRVGRRWVIPECGVEVYRARRRQLAALNGDGSQEQAEEGTKAIQVHEEGEPVKLEVIVKPEVCYCEAYPFPHRKGGGRCERTVAVGRKLVNTAGPSPSPASHTRQVERDEPSAHRTADDQDC